MGGSGALDMQPLPFRRCIHRAVAAQRGTAQGSMPQRPLGMALASSTRACSAGVLPYRPCLRATWRTMPMLCTERLGWARGVLSSLPGPTSEAACAAPRWRCRSRELPPHPHPHPHPHPETFTHAQHKCPRRGTHAHAYTPTPTPTHLRPRACARPHPRTHTHSLLGPTCTMSTSSSMYLLRSKWNIFRTGSTLFRHREQLLTMTKPIIDRHMHKQQ